LCLHSADALVVSGVCVADALVVPYAACSDAVDGVGACTLLMPALMCGVCLQARLWLCSSRHSAGRPWGAAESLPPPWQQLQPERRQATPARLQPTHQQLLLQVMAMIISAGPWLPAHQHFTLIIFNFSAHLVSVNLNILLLR